MLKLHIAVFLFGLAGLFSKFLSVPATTIVWGRTFFAVLATLLYLCFRGSRLRLAKPSDGYVLSLQGIVLAIHWFTFFYSIQVSSVAVGLLSFSTFPAFVMCLESILFKQPVKVVDVLGIALISLGLLFIVPEFEFSNRSFQGVLWGTISGFLFAVLTLLNRKLSGKYLPVHISLIQNLVAAIVLTPWALGAVSTLSSQDWQLLIVLGVFCTGLAHSLFINALTRTRAFVASIVASLEPVYGILAAAILLGEMPMTKEIIGGLMIVSATILISLRSGTLEEAG
jgi:drug/metabolite transporter (DMT)-like permease